MDADRNRPSNAVGLCLLPSDLLQDIFFRLALPKSSASDPSPHLSPPLISGDELPPPLRPPIMLRDLALPLQEEISS
ncbi:hypothetical protein CKAN_02753400 [Cinnamomum micranthum f. kanehirae]|uniref:Uncharacterized protein n=1 Tax=Cinnamomum micranthum f. kanehirae TaxID=337451 RepID=A0A3S3NSU7_9MAGN|nr:hypothetical protein CKAN_02753400 [Cinnamomum micranthum f. kanehirae]